MVGLAKSGLAAARLVARLGGRVLASDAAPREAWSPEARRLETERIAAWSGHPDAAFAGAELVVMSPGVPLELPALAPLRARGVPVISELELAWRVMEADVIAITGTNGKTTTTALTGEVLRGQVRPVLVGGNIGTPLSAHAVDFPVDGLVVAETSSFQLEATQLFRPRVAAVLNLAPDHLDRHGSYAAYVEAKARIFANQTEADCAVLNADDPDTAALAPRTRARVLWFSRAPRARARRSSSTTAGSSAKLNGHAEPVCPVGGDPAAGRPQRGERAGGHRVRAVDGHGPRDAFAKASLASAGSPTASSASTTRAASPSTTTPRAPTSPRRSRRSRASRSR